MSITSESSDYCADEICFQIGIDSSRMNEISKIVHKTLTEERKRETKVAIELLGGEKQSVAQPLIEVLDDVLRWINFGYENGSKEIEKKIKAALAKAEGK